ncbi:MAG TPA: GDP-mannose 4,6-dehydratase [Chloroflexota bacterium]|nr:GDP-mannose 4,6-dehydratase [Chloroflexota bacterium]
MRVLITGISGFAGSFLAEHCLEKRGVEVAGLVRDPARLGHAAALETRCAFLRGDVRDGAAVDAAMQESQPDIVFNLAGQASVAQSFLDPSGTLMDNAVGQLNVIQSILKSRPQARLLVVGSAYEYGLVRPDENPINEGAPLRPMDPYAVSKVAQDLFGYQYSLSHRLQAVRVRAFNHTGPRQSDDCVASRFARQIAEIEAGKKEAVLTVGNLTAVRDFTDVRDVVQAYFLAATKGQPGEVYNVGSGQARRIEEILTLLVGLSSVPVRVEEDEALLRPLDVPALICDAGKLRQHTGWEPHIPLERTLSDLLDYWRQQVKNTPEDPTTVRAA